MKVSKSVIKRQCITRNHLEENDNKINMECEQMKGKKNTLKPNPTDSPLTVTTAILRRSHLTKLRRTGPEATKGKAHK